MKVAFFSIKKDDFSRFEQMNLNYNHTLILFEAQLSKKTAILASGYPAINAFVNDILDEETLGILHQGGTKYITLRSAGFNNVDLKSAQKLGLTIARVPAYSPNAIAEYTLGLLLALSRKITLGATRAKNGNYSLTGLCGYNINGKTVGIIGTGKIGSVMVKLLSGFGCRILAVDKYQNSECLKLGVEYTDYNTLFEQSDIITLHCPLMKDTRHIINDNSISLMKDGVTLINTSRGALIDTKAVINALKIKKIGALAIDVYEEESEIFFEDHSYSIIQDDIFTRLLTFPNVIVTGHQAFYSKEAMDSIVKTTLENLTELEKTGTCKNIVTL